MHLRGKPSISECQHFLLSFLLVGSWFSTVWMYHSLAHRWWTLIWFADLYNYKTTPMNNRVQNVISQTSVDTFCFYKTNKLVQHPHSGKWHNSTRSGPAAQAEKYPSRAGLGPLMSSLFILVFPPCSLVRCVLGKPLALPEAWSSQRLLIISERARGKPTCSWENEWSNHGQFRILLLHRKINAFLMSFSSPRFFG